MTRVSTNSCFSVASVSLWLEPDSLRTLMHKGRGFWGYHKRIQLRILRDGRHRIPTSHELIKLGHLTVVAIDRVWIRN